MKSLKLAAVISGVTLLGAGMVLAATNPSQTDYESFAVAQLEQYLKKEVCRDTANTLGLNQNCEDLLKSNRPMIRRLISRRTERQNFFLFSLYYTRLDLMELLPSYKFETVGGLGQFYIYKSEKK